MSLRDENHINIASPMEKNRLTEIRRFFLLFSLEEAGFKWLQGRPPFGGRPAACCRIQ